MNENDSVHIVTGATGGLGRAIIAGLVEQGVQDIVLACRNAEKSKTLIAEYKGRARLTHIPLDLMSLESVRAFADEIHRRGYHIQALINNAGVLPERHTLSHDGQEAAMQTNYTATRLLTELLLDRMTTGSHIVLTTSLTRHITRLPLGRFTRYGLSKRKLHQWGLRLARELEPRGIIVALADPGAANTAMISMGCRPIDYLADRLARPLMSTPEQGAEPALMAAKADTTGLLFARRLGRTVVKKQL